MTGTSVDGTVQLCQPGLPEAEHVNSISMYTAGQHILHPLPTTHSKAHTYIHTFMPGL